MRNASIELLRIASAFAIVWFHAHVAGSSTAYAGLVVFIVVALYFEAGPNFERSVSVWRRTQRLLIPWAVWMGLYGSLRIVTHQPLLPNGILAGTSIHLWFLPFIFAAFVGLDAIKRAVSKPVLAYAALGTATLIMLTVAVWRAWPLQAPWAQWAHASAAVFVGITLGLAHCLAGIKPAALGALLGTMLYAALLPFPGVGWPYLVGTAAVIGVLTFAPAVLRGQAHIERVASAMFGVYLIHPFFLSRLHSVVIAGGILGVILVFALSSVVVLVAARFAPTLSRYVFGTR
jgi:hypothetical protein